MMSLVSYLCRVHLVLYRKSVRTLRKPLIQMLLTDRSMCSFQNFSNSSNTVVPKSGRYYSLFLPTESCVSATSCPIYLGHNVANVQNSLVSAYSSFVALRCCWPRCFWSQQNLSHWGRDCARILLWSSGIQNLKIWSWWSFHCRSWPFFTCCKLCLNEIVTPVFYHLASLCKKSSLFGRWDAVIYLELRLPTWHNVAYYL